ncbi:MAG: NAD-dependent epimerase/dehydratase family protein, partial [Flavobacteriales bacterium]|nr:NAD-dependent epimerase/dehydratase family protein [Flavobacteriales bacterium]
MADKVLVTGGLGYIGSHTVVELIENGFEVVIIDDLSNSHKETLEAIKEISSVKPDCEIFDICDASKLDELINNNKDIKATIHFAAYKAVGESVEEPIKYYKNNLNSLLNLLTVFEKLDVRRLVFSSSCSVYGEPLQIPVNEQTPTEPAESPYANTKLICEDICKDYFRNVDGSCILLRYFNPVGAHESALIGELPIGPPSN